MQREKSLPSPKSFQFVLLRKFGGLRFEGWISFEDSGNKQGGGSLGRKTQKDYSISNEKDWCPHRATKRDEGSPGCRCHLDAGGGRCAVLTRSPGSEKVRFSSWLHTSCKGPQAVLALSLWKAISFVWKIWVKTRWAEQLRFRNFNVHLGSSLRCKF